MAISPRTHRTERLDHRRARLDARETLLPLPTAGANDGKYFARIDAALVISDPRTGKAITLDCTEQSTLFRALEYLRDNDGSMKAAHLAARIDAI